MEDSKLVKAYTSRRKGEGVQDKSAPMALLKRSWPFARYLRPEQPQLLAQTMNAE